MYYREEIKIMKTIKLFIFLAISVVLLVTAGLANAQYVGGYGSCTYHAYKLCNGNNVYWYDSCGNQQELVQTCYGTNNVCQYGQCVYQPPVPVQPAYVAHKTIACYKTNLYWYDSLGQTSGLYQSCADSNLCTVDSCYNRKCSNTIKCDGSTCAVGSADYNTHCGGQNNNNNQQNNNQNQQQPLADNLSFSFFVKKDVNSPQWEKSADANNDSQVYFMISVVNNSSSQIDNINVSSNIPASVTLLGNLQVNGASISGDIVSGINIGTLPPSSGKTITFEGKTSEISLDATNQATASLNASGTTKSDSVSLHFVPGQATGAAVSSSQATTGFISFLKRWYLWILSGFVLIFLFVVVFRRLSKDN
jgi:hypothetical protein